MILQEGLFAVCFQSYLTKQGKIETDFAKQEQQLFRRQNQQKFATYFAIPQTYVCVWQMQLFNITCQWWGIFVSKPVKPAKIVCSMVFFFCWNWTVFGILVLFVPMSQCTSSVFLCCVFLTLPSQWSLCHCIRYPVRSTWPFQSFKTFNIHESLSALSSECDIPVAGIFRCYRKNLAQKKDRNLYFLIWYRKKYQNQYR